MSHELFAPVLYVMKVKDLDHAIQLNNAVPQVLLRAMLVFSSVLPPLDLGYFIVLDADGFLSVIDRMLSGSGFIFVHHKSSCSLQMDRLSVADFAKLNQ